MKRIFAVIMIIAMLALFALPAAASEIAPEEPGTESVAPDVTEDNEGEVRMFDRLSEIWDTYSAEIISGGGIEYCRSKFCQTAVIPVDGVKLQHREFFKVLAAVFVGTETAADLEDFFAPLRKKHLHGKFR